MLRSNYNKHKKKNSLMTVVKWANEIKKYSTESKQDALATNA